jgi:hypothetical protein
VPPSASDIDDFHAGINQASRRRRANAVSHFFGNHRHVEVQAHFFDPPQQPFEVGVPFGLNGFLQCIEVQHQRVGFDHIDRTTTFIHAKTVVELHGAEVRQQRNRRCDMANAIGIRQAWIDQCCALRADPHRQPKRFSRFGERHVDPRHITRTTGHRTDKERRAHSFSQKRHAGIDFGKVEFGCSLVRHAVSGETGGDPFGSKHLLPAQCARDRACGCSSVQIRS